MSVESGPEAGNRERSSPRRRAWLRRGATRGAAAGGCVVVAAIYLGMASLHDNSFFTHLATGHVILDGHVPTVDPYSFTAKGEPWVVQSWFASLLYSLTDRIGHGLGIRLMIGGLSGILALVLWRLTRPARSIVVRLAAIVPPLVVGAANWGPRPLVFGLVGFALVLLVLREERDPRWLLPVMWIWVNTHGSFPLGMVLIVSYGVGCLLDGHSYRHPLRTFIWAGVGVLLGAVNPLGARLLWFPVELLFKQDVLRYMIEWKAPGFESTWQRVFLITVVVAAALAPRLSKSDCYRVLVPALLFSLMGFIAMRNIALATIVLTPLIAVELKDLGSLTSRVRSRAYSASLVALAVVTIGVVITRASTPSFDYSTYPEAAVTYLERTDRLSPDHRLVTPDVVGNYLELRYLGDVPVFVDDRVDMYPRSVVEDEVSLVQAKRDWSRVLDKWDVDTVLWGRESTLSTLLAASDEWRLDRTFGPGEAGGGSWVIYERVKPRGA